MVLKQISRSLVLLAVFGAFLSAQDTAPKADDSKPPAKEKGPPALPPEVMQMLGMAPPEDPVAVARGNKDFVANCAFCHGSSATGGEGGPDLVRSLLVLHDEKGDKIGPVILNGRKTMPKFPFTPAQIADIASFLHSQAAHVGNRDSYEIHNVLTGDAKAGEVYFNHNCSGCHSPAGDLAKVATRYDPVALQSRFLFPKSFTYPGMPETGPKPKPKTVKVTLASGQSFSGNLKHLDDFNVSLSDSEGVYHSWLLDRNPGIKIEVHDPLSGHAELIQRYTDADMHNILAYLETLK